MTNKAKGYTYFVGREQIEQYKAWPIMRRLSWLLEGNKLRKNLPEKTIALQEAFRRGKL
jgi:hypothetical protein